MTSFYGIFKKGGMDPSSHLDMDTKKGPATSTLHEHIKYSYIIFNRVICLCLGEGKKKHKKNN